MDYKKNIKMMLYVCQGCSYRKMGNNILDFEGMEIVNDCKHCGGYFKLKCPECGKINKTKKVEI